MLYQVSENVQKDMHTKSLAVKSSILFILCLLLIPGVLAHAPSFPGDNERIDNATYIQDPTKSWAIYAQLHEGGEAQYYRFYIAEGQKISIALNTPADPSSKGFLPSIVLMGPNVTTHGQLPSYVQVPEGAGVLVEEGKKPTQATYEAFAPSSFNELAELQLNAPTSGTYYVAVYDSSSRGHYGLAIGDRESYTPLEYILIPISLITAYQWEGQGLAQIFAPLVMTVVIGLVLLVWNGARQKRTYSFVQWVVALAGLLFIGSGVSTFYQMLFTLTRTPVTPQITLTLVLAFVPTILGLLTLRITLVIEGTLTVKTRVYLFILGLVALFAWAGLLMGPALAMLSSILPSRTRAPPK